MTPTIIHSIMFCECIRSRIFSLETPGAGGEIENATTSWLCAIRTPINNMAVDILLRSTHSEGREPVDFLFTSDRWVQLWPGGLMGNLASKGVVLIDDPRPHHSSIQFG